MSTGVRKQAGQDAPWISDALDALDASVKAEIAAHQAIPEAEHVHRISERMRRFDPTALSHWFPLLEAAGLPVPKTILLEMPEAAQAAIWRSFDGQGAEDNALAEFIEQVCAACDTVGYPAFLRTDHTSGKHDWRRCCFVESHEHVPANVSGLATFSEVHMLPWARWVVREFLPTIPFGVCPHYAGMPVCREFRFFVTEGIARCVHPYWPDYSLELGGAESIDFDELCRMPNEGELRALAEAAGRAVPGSWSIDLLETERGWFITDMAEAHKSFHWDDCPNKGLKP